MLLIAIKMKDVHLLKEMFYFFIIIIIIIFHKCVESPCYEKVGPNCPYGCQNANTGGFFFFYFVFFINKLIANCQYDFCTQYESNICPNVNSPCEVNDDGKCGGIDCGDVVGCKTGNAYCGTIGFVYIIF
jgi:hypothetical protein